MIFHLSSLGNLGTLRGCFFKEKKNNNIGLVQYRIEQKVDNSSFLIATFTLLGYATTMYLRDASHGPKYAYTQSIQVFFMYKLVQDVCRVRKK